MFRRWFLRAGERGSAVVDFVLVTPLLVLVALGVVQVALVLHVRATLTAAAAEGARAASLAGADPAAGEARTRQLLAGTIAGVRDITVAARTVDGLPVMVVRVAAELPLVGLLAPDLLVVEGRALREGWT